MHKSAHAGADVHMCAPCSLTTTCSHFQTHTFEKNQPDSWSVVTQTWWHVGACALPRSQACPQSLSSRQCLDLLSQVCALQTHTRSHPPSTPHVCVSMAPRCEAHRSCGGQRKPQSRILLASGAQMGMASQGRWLDPATAHASLLSIFVSTCNMNWCPLSHL